MADEIDTTVADHVCSITLNRPAKRNALTTAMIADLGAAFCAGLDLAELAAQRDAGRVETHGLEHALEILERCLKPTLAAVQGDAIAGGCELALHCDLRVAADNARFAMPLARIGLAVPVALTWKLVETIGAAATKELLFTGEPIGADAALGLGLVNRVVAAADLDAAAAALARQVAHNAPLALLAMKAFVQRAGDERRQWRRDDLEALERRVRESSDVREGLAAQRERRPPLFKGE